MIQNGRFTKNYYSLLKYFVSLHLVPLLCVDGHLDNEKYEVTDSRNMKWNANILSENVRRNNSKKTDNSVFSYIKL